MRSTAFLLAFCFLAVVISAQTSDSAFRKPLKEVIDLIQTRFKVKIRYTEALVIDRWVTYGEWRFRPEVEKTVTNIFASQDITFAKEGEGKYKLQDFQYHLKTPGEGREQLEYLSALYNDKEGWEKRKGELKGCLISSLRSGEFLKKTSEVWKTSEGVRKAKTYEGDVRRMNGYTIKNIAIEVLPGLYVCGSLYSPENSTGKIPVILNPDGHFENGRYRADCQYRCAMLAKMGAMAFSYDLFAWGESLLQFKTEDHRRALAQTIQALNAIRILDYLLSLKNADKERVAITGGSVDIIMLLARLKMRILQMKVMTMVCRNERPRINSSRKIFI